MIGRILALFRRRPAARTPVVLTLVPAAVDAPDAGTARPRPVCHGDFEPASGPDIDPEDYDFERGASGKAVTAKFVAWHFEQYPDQIGLSRAKLWTRYQLYCCVTQVRPLTQGRWVQTLKDAGVRPRRIRAAGGKRPTVYDVELRRRQRSAA